MVDAVCIFGPSFASFVVSKKRIAGFVERRNGDIFIPARNKQVSWDRNCTRKAITESEPIVIDLTADRQPRIFALPLNALFGSSAGEIQLKTAELYKN